MDESYYKIQKLQKKLFDKLNRHDSKIQNIQQKIYDRLNRRNLLDPEKHRLEHLQRLHHWRGHRRMGFGAALVAFAIGVYSGIYIDQNYKVPRADEPKELWRKVKEFASQYKKPDSGPPTGGM